MQTPISLDIQRSLAPQLDIKKKFTFSEFHAIDNRRFKRWVDEIPLHRPNLDLSAHTQARVLRPFSCIPMLDICLRDVIKSPFWQAEFPYLRRAYHRISLVPPLKKPLDSLDIRDYHPLAHKKYHSDLYRRKLPFWFRLRRFLEQSDRFFRENKKILFRSAMVFASFLLVILATIPLSLYAGYQSLKSLSHAKNITEISAKISTARAHFERARLFYLPFSWLPVGAVDTVGRATMAAQSLSRAADGIFSSLPAAENLTPKIVKNTDGSIFRSASKNIFPLENYWIAAPTDWIEKNTDRFLAAASEIIFSAKILSETSGDHKYEKMMRTAGEALSGVATFLEKYRDNPEIILKMLGHRDPQRYLIFNQNRDEIRTNGGFPGSIITFTFYKGNILDFRTDDVYYYDWNLYPYKELPPPGLALLSNNFGLRDVNYYPDFSQTLEKANSFVERSGEQSLTTAIAIHQGIIEDILRVTGPISLEGVPIAFDSENFSTLMSLLVENKFGKNKTPKDILFHFMEKFAKEMLRTKNWEKIVAILADYADRGEILAASRDSEINEFLQSIQPALPWYSNAKNWVYPVFTSVSGNKSDRYISRKIEVNTVPAGKCEYRTTLKILSHHHYDEYFDKKMENYMNIFGITDIAEREKMKFIQGNGENRAFVRVMVPKGAKLLNSESSKNIEVSEEENATVFAFMMNTPVAKTSEKSLEYQQKIENCREYNNSVRVFRQPGLRDFTVIADE